MDKTNAEKVTGQSRRRRHTRAEIEQIVARYRASGLTQAEFAAQAGLRPWSLRNWLSQQRRGVAPAASGGPHFASVQLCPAPVGTITVRWPQGVQVEVAVPLDPASVGQLVRELVTSCSR